MLCSPTTIHASMRLGRWERVLAHEASCTVTWLPGKVEWPRSANRTSQQLYRLGGHCVVIGRISGLHHSSLFLSPPPETNPASIMPCHAMPALHVDAFGWLAAHHARTQHSETERAGSSLSCFTPRSTLASCVLVVLLFCSLCLEQHT